MTDQPTPRRHTWATAGLLAAATAALLLMATGPTQAATATVAARNYVFQPATRTIAVGDVVRWSFAGDPHSVTSRDGLFDSGVTDPGGSFQFTFTKAGTYRYFCQVHPEQMFGTIVVRASAATPRPTVGPTPRPTVGPTPKPTLKPTPVPTARPTATPAPSPTIVSSASPSAAPAASAAPSESTGASPAEVTAPGPSGAAASPVPTAPSSPASSDTLPFALAAIVLAGLLVGGLLVARGRRAA